MVYVAAGGLLVVAVVVGVLVESLLAAAPDVVVVVLEVVCRRVTRPLRVDCDEYLVSALQRIGLKCEVRIANSHIGR